MPTQYWDLRMVILLTCQLQVPTQRAAWHHQTKQHKESKIQAVAYMENATQAVTTARCTTQAVAYMGSATQATLLTRSAMQYFQAAYKGLSHQQCARHLQEKQLSQHNLLQAGMVIPTKPTYAQTGMFIPNKMTYDHGLTQSSSMIT